MKILHLCYDHPDNPWCGGGGARRNWAINEILGKKHDITLFCGYFPGAITQDLPFKVRFLGNAEKYVESRLKFMFYSRKLNTTQYDLVVEEFSYYAPILRKFKEIPCVTVLQGQHGLKALLNRGVYGAISLISEYCILPFRQNVIIVSDHLKSALHPKTSFKVIGQGVDIPKNFSAPSEDYILFIGRLDIWHKGIDTLIKAWSILTSDEKKLPLYIAGGGDLKGVKKLNKSYNSNGIKLLGKLDHKAALSAINNAAFLCMPSRMEGSPLVLYEALALGKPVIGSAIPPIQAILNDQKGGILVPPDDAHGFAKAIKLLLGNKNFRKKQSEKAFEIGKEFSWESVAVRQEVFYKEVVG